MCLTETDDTHAGFCASCDPISCFMLRGGAIFSTFLTMSMSKDLPRAILMRARILSSINQARMLSVTIKLNVLAARMLSFH